MLFRFSLLTYPDLRPLFRNMLLPDGVTADRQRARFFFRIYHAEGLPKMNTTVTEKLKSMLQGEHRDLVDPYVEISFCGQKVTFIFILAQVCGVPHICYFLLTSSNQLPFEKNNIYLFHLVFHSLSW